MTIALPIDASEAERFSVAKATDAQLELGRQCIMAEFEASNKRGGARGSEQIAMLKVMHQHKVEIEAEQSKRRGMT